MSTHKAILSRLVKNMKKRDVEPLRPLIDAYILERDDAPERYQNHSINMRPRLRPGGRFSPSSICGCRRQAVFKFVGMRGRRGIDPDRELIFEDGNWRHHKWQAIFMDMMAVLGRERFRVRSTEAVVEIPELYIAGNSDNELTYMGRQHRVLDIKGINDAGFTRVYTEDEPIPEHVRQLTTYGKGSKRKRGSLLYDNKNNQQTKIFDIIFEDGVWYEVQEWVEDGIDNMNREKLPPMHPECQAGNFLYQKCPYSGICYGSASDVRIRRRMYGEFPGVEEAWQAGRAAIEAGDAIDVD